MDNLEKAYFDKLCESRTKIADALEDPAARNMWRSIVDKYSDQAHFIYELIQNADDAGATSVRFKVEYNRLIFIHNGTRHFSITNPLTEENDSIEGSLGDINAITAIAFSSKKTQQNKIGKFGVGFKAVFQYTSIPHIYDPNFCFCIDRYIVPKMLDSDFPSRQEGETVFVFPFNHKDRDAKETYKDISEKLKTLSYPITFLTNLHEITFEINNISGYYRKSITEVCNFGEDTAEKVCLIRNNGEETLSQDLWLFSRNEGELKYSVGFFLDENKQLVPVNEPAFCFFPTKEMTRLNFLVHAPFILTDSREGIRVGVAHNNKMISLLSKLAADSMIYLRDIGMNTSERLINDDIFSIIPIQEDIFCDLDDTSRISFKPFYSAIKNIFQTESLIPTRDGYTVVENAYWAAVPFLTQLFSDTQLADICENIDAKWVFLSLGRDGVQSNNKKLFSYIDSITKTGLTEDALINGRSTYAYGIRKKEIKGIDGEFIEKQDISWLHKLYKWLSESNHRTELAKKKPIFLNQDARATSSFDDNNRLILFLPVENLVGYKTVYEELLKNKDTYEFIKKVGVTIPSIHDQIYNVILPQYKTTDGIDTDPHFMLFFKYYCQCPRENVDDFIEEIRDCHFITYYTQNNSQRYRGKAAELYLPNKELLDYFESKPTTKFVAIEEYKSLIGTSEDKYLLSFLSELGVKKYVDIYENELTWNEINLRKDLPEPYSTKTRTYIEKCIEGCKEIIEFIVQNKSKDKSVILWNQLLQIISTESHYGGLTSLLKGRCRYFYYSSQVQDFTSSIVTLLCTANWLVNENGDFVSCDKLSINTLSDIYNIENEEVIDLLSFLGIENQIDTEEDTSLLSDKQRKQIERAKICDELGLTIEDLKEMAKIKSRRKVSNTFSESSTAISDEELEEELIKDINDDDSHRNKFKLNNRTSRVAKDIIRKTNPIPATYDETDLDEHEDIDADEFIPSSVDFSKKVELEKQKAAKAIDKIAYQEELQERALGATRYSYGWFKVLLELETLNSSANNLNSKEISISFASVERELGTQRTLILKQPNRYIPQFMENLADISLVLRIGDQTKKLVIEVANVKSYTLRVKLKSNIQEGELDFSQVIEARIDAKSPVFLLEELRKQFVQLGYDDDYNMQQNLCENIEFVFGPPGTGKTTHLAKNVLIPLMEKEQDLKVLVLTPTNKASDVLVRRIMEVMDNDVSYSEWLVRFGGTGDGVIEQSTVYRDKTFDIRALAKNVTVTTIARFPYDFFMPQGSRIFLNGINWDYIIIDEASMIPLANIIYPLYKKTPQKFIIAGDPFQIEPITSVDLWKNENIYTLVSLNSFAKPETIPYDYKVKLLTTQYRSVPSIGSIFSQFAYSGILQHYRNEDSKKSLNIEDKLDLNSLNIIKFPISKYESIYRSKRLKHSSSYQIYSALFTFEFVSYLSSLIAKVNPDDFFRIGVIAPYRAQADLIEKLLRSTTIPKEIDVQVGTIHGFQGDECDIIFAVFNTPPTITSGKDMFLNNRNIINVSISRAKDYLFIVMPDDNTENINNLSLVKHVEQLFKDSSAYSEFQTHDLEQRMFSNACYLEENTFSTGHQSVNVYGLPEKCYEIRSEDDAVDVQIHRSLGTQPNRY